LAGPILNHKAFRGKYTKEHLISIAEVKNSVNNAVHISLEITFYDWHCGTPYWSHQI